jgi:hypothetical protein
MNVILPEKVFINARKLLAEFLHCFRNISLIYYELKHSIHFLIQLEFLRHQTF